MKSASKKASSALSIKGMKGASSASASAKGMMGASAASAKSNTGASKISKVRHFLSFYIVVLVAG